MAPITINGNTLDPVAEAPVLRALGLETPDASKSNYILLQVSDILSSAEKSGLAELGLVIPGCVAENTYLYKYEDTNLETIRSLPFVIWANVYLKEFKIRPVLKELASATPSRFLPALSVPSNSRFTHLVDIVLHEGVDPSSDVVISGITAAAHVQREDLVVCRDKVRLGVQARYLNELAS